MAAPVTTYASIADLDSAINGSALAGVSITAKQKALDDASSEMRSRIQGQFVMPLTRVGGDMKRHCVNIAIYYCLGGRGYNPELGGDVFVRDMYKAAIAWCDSVRDGTITPDVDDSREAIAGVPHTAPVVISSSQRGFTDRGTSDRLPFQGD